jgi:hypothetical protein
MEVEMPKTLKQKCKNIMKWKKRRYTKKRKTNTKFIQMGKNIWLNLVKTKNTKEKLEKLCESEKVNLLFKNEEDFNKKHDKIDNIYKQYEKNVRATKKSKNIQRKKLFQKVEKNIQNVLQEKEKKQTRKVKRT